MSDLDHEEHVEKAIVSQLSDQDCRVAITWRHGADVAGYDGRISVKEDA